MSDPEYDIDFRENPEAYEVGRGEEGAFKVQPYKDELLPLWGIKSLEEAEEAAAAIYERFCEYREADEFVGMDMARKYLQMGWTRSLRYAKYPGGGSTTTTGTSASPGSGTTRRNTASPRCTGSTWTGCARTRSTADSGRAGTSDRRVSVQF